MIDKKLNIPQVSGIDTLYYFAKSGGYYKEYFRDNKQWRKKIYL